MPIADAPDFTSIVGKHEPEFSVGRMLDRPKNSVGLAFSEPTKGWNGSQWLLADKSFDRYV
jgi:hypothetical protein